MWAIRFLHVNINIDIYMKSIFYMFKGKNNVIFQYKYQF